jgi:hypothetical protein
VRGAAALALTLGVTLAQAVEAADCPTSADLGRGIEFMQINPPLIIVVRRQGGQLVGTLTALMAYGVHGMPRRYIEYPSIYSYRPKTVPYLPLLAQGGPMYPSPMTRVEYGTGPIGPDALVTQTHAEAPVQEFLGSKVFDTGTASWDVVNSGSLTIGPCRYEAVDVRETDAFAHVGKTTWQDVLVPELGFVISRSLVSEAGIPNHFQGIHFTGIALAPFP